MNMFLLHKRNCLATVALALLCSCALPTRIPAHRFESAQTTGSDRILSGSFMANAVGGNFFVKQSDNPADGNVTAVEKGWLTPGLTVTWGFIPRLEIETYFWAETPAMVRGRVQILGDSTGASMEAQPLLTLSLGMTAQLFAAFGGNSNNGGFPIGGDASLMGGWRFNPHFSLYGGFCGSLMGITASGIKKADGTTLPTQSVGIANYSLSLGSEAAWRFLFLRGELAWGAINAGGALERGFFGGLALGARL